MHLPSMTEIATVSLGEEHDESALEAELEKLEAEMTALQLPSPPTHFNPKVPEEHFDEVSPEIPDVRRALFV